MPANSSPDRAGDAFASSVFRSSKRCTTPPMVCRQVMLAVYKGAVVGQLSDLPAADLRKSPGFDTPI